MANLVPVILSGGVGSRLWPLSRREQPKQLARLVGEHSLLQQTVERAASAAAGEPIIVCGSGHHAAIVQQLDAIGRSARLSILEPFGRNTAPAVATAALSVEQDDLLLVLPADHVIADTAAFGAAVETAAHAASAGHLVTFGIRPTTAHTGYGYIRQGASLTVEGAFSVEAFVEKPDASTAESFLAAGDYTWNSGMFLFSAGAFLADLQEHRPEMLDRITATMAASSKADGVLTLDADTFEAVPSESIDYAVMEHTTRAAVVPLDAGWNDVGSWDALWELADKEAEGNVTEGAAYLVNTSGSYVRAQDRPVVVVGLDNVVVVDTGDALLVMSRDASEQVKDAVSLLEADGRDEVVRPPDR